MNDVLLNWFLLISVFGLALASPGPDFVIAVRNSLSFSRLAGVITAIGFAAGVGVHVTYTLLGLAAIIAQSAILFTLIKIAGAGYLFYLAYHALRSQGFKSEQGVSKIQEQSSLSFYKCLESGFLTNLLNPKASLFFLAVFSQFVTPTTSLSIQVLYGFTCVLMTFGWFSLVALFLTTPPVRNAFFKITKWLDRFCGIVLIGLGVKLLLTRAPL